MKLIEIKENLKSNLLLCNSGTGTCKCQHHTSGRESEMVYQGLYLLRFRNLRNKWYGLLHQLPEDCSIPGNQVRKQFGHSFVF